MRHGGPGLLQQCLHFVVADLREIAIPLRNRQEHFRLFDAHEFVGFHLDRALQPVAGATGTATTTTTRAAPLRRVAAIAARTLQPVAMPSSTRMTVFPFSSSGGRPPRYALMGDSSSFRAAAATSWISCSDIPRGFMSERSRTRTLSSAIAPIATSCSHGVPILVTTKTSRGSLSALATAAATGTPPRGSPKTITSWRPEYAANFPASISPASARSANGRTSRSSSSSRKSTVRLSVQQTS